MINEFANSGAWGGAGLALGAGIAEGMNDERRHQELLMALTQSTNANHYIAKLEAANRAAEALYFQTKGASQDKDAKILHLEAMLEKEKGVSSQRATDMSTLHDALVSFEASSTKLLEDKNKFIDEQKKMLEKMSDLIAAKDGIIGTAEEVMATFENHILSLEKKISLLTSHASRLEKQFYESDARAKRWKDQYIAANACQEEFYDRLQRIDRGEEVSDITGPAKITLSTVQSKIAPEAFDTFKVANALGNDDREIDNLFRNNKQDFTENVKSPSVDSEPDVKP